jgi:hypothetical protein
MGTASSISAESLPDVPAGRENEVAEATPVPEQQGSVEQSGQMSCRRGSPPIEKKETMP